MCSCINNTANFINGQAIDTRTELTVSPALEIFSSESHAWLLDVQVS